MAEHEADRDEGREAEESGAPSAAAPSEPVEPEAVRDEPIGSEPIRSEPIGSEPIGSEPIRSEPGPPEPDPTEPVAPSGPTSSDPGSPGASADPSAPASASTSEPTSSEVPGHEAAAGPEPSIDEDAAWAEIVAGYGDEPPDPPGAKPFKSIEDLALLDPERNGPGQDTDTGEGPDTGKRGHRSADDDGNADGTDDDNAGDAPSGKGGSLGGSVAFAPGVGPRDYRTPAPSEDDFDGDDEGHFVPPEPPPLPTADTTARFAWLAVIGGPILLLIAVLLGWEMTWYLTLAGIGGFVGGFTTLVVRMKSDDDENDDPGRGAVV